MKTQTYCFVIVVSLFLCIPFTAMGFEQGFSLFGGISTVNVDNSTSGFEDDFTGVNIGFDYQIELNEGLSINPFLDSSHGEGGTIASGGFLFETELSVVSVGAQLRFWFNEFFLGAHIANYSGEITSTEVTTGISFTDTASGIGFGGALGFENESGLLLFFRLYFVTLDQADLTGMAGNIGYRF